MKLQGFRRTGRTFWRNGSEVCHVATLEMSRWGSRDESSFSVQLGVFWHRVEALLENASVGKMPPPSHRCTFRIDLGRTISMPPKPSWKVTHESDFAALGCEVLQDLRNFGLPWFEYRSDLQRSLEWKRYAVPEGNDRYSIQELVLPRAKVVFEVMLGKEREAIEDLKRFAANGYPEDAIQLAERLGLKNAGILL
ncbi:MAG TPA: DUF4304 domain-containing protein [Humisphaera sp.]|nr:DUF4304 domain-containing protein [Humisphaera sp.]